MLLAFAKTFAWKANIIIFTIATHSISQSKAQKRHNICILRFETSHF
ncbi:hypothetical protein BPUTSESOX_1527 [uncultured Gammaproteobacteria bacterium]|nr:hypothetical protein [uncultured Gammaproteobacteria bacterium]VVH51556.1 hypothetical protein BPUTSESOX_1527 [uncultured Gammaproteobacteria bacterium]